MTGLDLAFSLGEDIKLLGWAPCWRVLRQHIVNTRIIAAHSDKRLGTQFFSRRMITFCSRCSNSQQMALQSLLFYMLKRTTIDLSDSILFFTSGSCFLTVIGNNTTFSRNKNSPHAFLLSIPIQSRRRKRSERTRKSCKIWSKAFRPGDGARACI